MDPSITSLLFIFQIFATSFASDNVRQVNGGVEVLHTGHYSFDLKDKFILQVPDGPCDDPIELCYPAKAIIDEYGEFYKNSNYAKRCASKDCAITITDGEGTVGGNAELIESGNYVFTFDDDAKDLCPRKTNGTIQSFALTRLPSGCRLVVMGVSLSSEEDENEESSGPWLGILAGVGVVTLFGVLVAIGTFFLYKYTIKQPAPLPTVSKKTSNPQATQPTPSTTPSPVKQSTSPAPSSIAAPTDPKI
uniref:Uncharacterized protein n=1 Tax=Panagrellus redivivus TaxID=6233 RepID=A0A7E4W5V7_PANRE